MGPIARGRRIRRVAAWIVGLAVLLLGLAYVGVSTFTADRLTRPTNHPLPFDPHRVSDDVRAWSARTGDGITLRGWYLPTEKKRQLLVLVHGMWSSWVEMAGLGRDLHDRGFDVLLFDLRGHGQSDPSRLYLGPPGACRYPRRDGLGARGGIPQGPGRLARVLDGRLDGAHGGGP